LSELCKVILKNYGVSEKEENKLRPPQQEGVVQTQTPHDCNARA